MNPNQELFGAVSQALREAGYTGITAIHGPDGDSVMASKDGGAALFRISRKAEFASLRERLVLHPIVASAFGIAAASK